MSDAFYITAEALAARGRNNLPPELVSASNLIYSSPATLAFNSPGAQGFGVKRAGLAVPESVMLLIAPRCCGRNTAALSDAGYSERFFYLLQDDTDIVTGRHLTRIPEAVREVCEACEKRPSAVMICITCVDALLGTDMERVCRKAAEYAGVPVVPCYMYALTREGRLPPMVSVRRSVYSLLKKTERKADAVNLLGFFSPFQDNCELYSLLRGAGLRHIREISRCRSFAEYQRMAEANFNLILNPEARHAAQDMQKNLGIPSIELTRLYQLDKVQNQYRLLGNAIGKSLNDNEFYDRAAASAERFRRNCGTPSFAVGEWLNGDPFELSLALLRGGFPVKEIFGTVGDANFIYIKKIAALSPETRIYSNLSPSMLYYQEDSTKPDLVIGKDARYYHPQTPGADWNEEIQPFGYAGIEGLFNTLEKLMTGETV